MDLHTRTQVQQIFKAVDERFGSTWSIPWKKVLGAKLQLDSYCTRYPNVDWNKGGGLLQLCRPGAGDYQQTYMQLAKREMLVRKLRRRPF